MNQHAGRAPRPFDTSAFDPSAFGSAWSAERRRGTDVELRTWLDLAMTCCDAADEIALRHFRRDLTISTKPDRSLVTQADRAIEALVRDRLRARYPDHGVVGEEFGTEDGGASARWYVDPIDGTHNFVRGVPLFATLLAVERDGEVQVGVISAPALRSRWFAWRGGGAWATGDTSSVPNVPPGDPSRPSWSGDSRRIRCSRVADVAESQVLYSSPRDLDRSGWAPGFPVLVERAWRERGFGDFWGYALVAQGAAEAMVEVGIHSWDLAAPQILVEEAGGRMTDLGGDRTIHGASVLASNGLLHARILATLAGARPR